MLKSRGLLGRLRTPSALYQPVSVIVVRLSRESFKLASEMVAPLAPMVESELFIEKPAPEGALFAAEKTAPPEKVAVAPVIVPKLAEVVPVPSEKLYCSSMAECACVVMNEPATKVQASLPNPLRAENMVVFVVFIELEEGD